MSDEAKSLVDELRGAAVHYWNCVNEWMEARPDDEQGTSKEWNKFEKFEERLRTSGERLTSALARYDRERKSGPGEPSYNTLVKRIARLERALAGAIPWIGMVSEGPAWATPDAKRRNSEMAEKALADACNCFPEVFDSSVLHNETAADLLARAATLHTANEGDRE